MKPSIDQISAPSNDSPPPPSEGCIALWESLENHFGDLSKEQQFSEEIVSTVFDFGSAGKGLSPEAYDAAYLSQIMDSMGSADDEHAKQLCSFLKTYQHDNPKARDLVLAAAADSVAISKFLDYYWEQSQDEDSTSTPRDASKREYENFWAKPFKQIPAQKRYELVANTRSAVSPNPKAVNIESVLIGGSIHLAKLRKAETGDVNENELRRTVHALETFYRPTLELSGYKAMASSIVRETELLRLSRNGGTYGKLTTENLMMQRAYLAELPSPKENLELVETLLGRLLHKECKMYSVVKDTTGHGIQFAAGGIYAPESFTPDPDEEIIPSEEMPEARVVFRLKTDVSAAKKSDVVRDADTDALLGGTYDAEGLNIITPDREHLAQLFMTMSASVLHLDKMAQPVTSSSKSSAWHAKGGPMIEAVSSDLALEGVKIDTAESKNGHYVAKINLAIPRENQPPIYFEIQFQTEEDRYTSEAGSASHSLKDEGYGVSGKDVLLGIKGLHDRRESVREPGVTLLSKRRAEELFGGTSVATLQGLSNAAGIRKLA